MANCKESSQILGLCSKPGRTHTTTYYGLSSHPSPNVWDQGVAKDGYGESGMDGGYLGVLRRKKDYKWDNWLDAPHTRLQTIGHHTYIYHTYP